MKNQLLIQILSLLAVAVSILLVLFLLTVKTKNRLSNLFFGFFILLNALELSSWLTNQYLQDIPWLLMLRVTCSALINPLFYLYLLALLYNDFRVRPQHIWHALPFALTNLLLLPDFYLTDRVSQALYLQHYSQHWPVQFFEVVSHLQFWVYIIAGFWKIIRFRKVYQENFAEAGMQTYNWALQLTTWIVVVHSVIIIKDLLPFTRFAFVHEAALVLVSLNALFINSWFILKTMFHPELFRQMDSHIVPLKEPDPQPPSAEQTDKIQQLRQYMTTQEPFLDPQLNIQQLAGQLQIPVRELSILINQQIGQHFFDFVNEYRIRKAMDLLRRHTNAEMTIQQILFAVGFNSKSSFHTAFKKLSDLTPSAYRSLVKAEK